MVILVPPKDIQLSKNFIKNIKISINYLRNDGAKAFYRGLVPNVIRTGFSSSIYFSFLRLCETTCNKFDNEMLKGKLGTFLSSLSARIFSSLAANPLTVI